MRTRGRMTERRARRTRATRRELRAWAWVAGGLALVAPWAAVADAPEAATGHDERPVLIVRKVTRRVVITHPAQPAGVRYVYVNGPSSSSSRSGSSGSAGGAPPPTTSTGGS